MDISKALSITGKHLTNKLGNGLGMLAHQIARPIKASWSVANNLKNMMFDDFGTIVNTDAPYYEDNLKNLKFWSFAKNLYNDVKNPTAYNEHTGKMEKVKKLSPETKRLLISLALASIILAPLPTLIIWAPALMIAGFKLGFRTIKSAFKLLRNSSRQKVAKTGGPSIENAPGPRIQPPVNANTQTTSLGQNNALRGTFANAALKLADPKATPQPIPTQPLYSKAGPNAARPPRVAIGH